MAQENEILKFTYPQCGNSGIEEIMDGVILLLPIHFNDDEEMAHHYGEIEYYDGKIICHQCPCCGYVLPDCQDAFDVINYLTQ